MRELKQDRSYILYLLLNYVTCGIYGLYVVWDLSRDVNEICEDDGEKTRGLGMTILFNIISCMCYRIIWWYQVCKRMNTYCADNGLKPTVTSLEYLILHLIPFGMIFAKCRLFKMINAVAVHYNDSMED